MFVFDISVADEEDAISRGFDVGVMECDLDMHQNSGSDLAFDAQTDRSSYKINDALTLQVTPEDDVYISVIDQGSDLKWPERGHALFENVFIQQGQTYTFPPPNAGILEISGPVGTNVFEVIASIAPIDDPSANSKNVNLVKKDHNKANLKTESSRCALSFEIAE